MNALINNDMPLYPCVEEVNNTAQTPLGDIVAVCIVAIFTVSALLVGSWSGIMLLTGDICNVSPLWYIICFMQSLGIL